MEVAEFQDLPECPVRMLQSPLEFGSLWEMASLAGAQTVIEIGSLYGGTLWYWLQLPTAAHVVTVDQLTEYEPPRTEVLADRERWHRWPRHDQILTILEGDSHSSKMVDQAAVEPGTAGLLFIDGDHSYEGVKADFELWSPLVRPGGIVAFHDTVPTEWAHEPGVVQFVNELKKQHSSVEWFDARNGGVGITAFLLGQ